MCCACSAEISAVNLTVRGDIGASNGLHKLEKDTYKMRISINALLNKSDTQKTGAKTSSGPKDKSAGNPFGNSDSEDEVCLFGL